MEHYRQVRLVARPHGLPKLTDFEIATVRLPKPGAGEFLIRVNYLSVDPYMRILMNETYSYVDPIEIGQMPVAHGVGMVIESQHPDFKPGMTVAGPFGWQEYCLSEGRHVQAIDPQRAPVTTALGVLGMPGLSAYFGMLEICRPRKGDTVVVSTAAGAVGSIAAQIAQIQGAHVVGITGTEAKRRYLLDELKLDGALNYRATEDYLDALGALCPKGINAYFDNVGGPVTDAVLMNLAPRARIALCGQISLYNQEHPDLGPRLLWRLITTQSMMQGFMVYQYADHFQEALEQLLSWLQQGRLHYKETILNGIDNMPQAFIDMLQGKKIGKQLVRVHEWDPSGHDTWAEE